ncbi:MAG: hypothetical protein ACLQVY_03070 [Limisphaerales bacterium]
MTATCFAENVVETETIIAAFGEATLIQRPEGGYALAGGSLDDRVEAKEWISLFMHEVLIRDN